MVRYRRTFSMMARLFMFGSPLLSRGRICGTTIFDSLAALEERTCGFRTVDGASSRVDRRNLSENGSPAASIACARRLGRGRRILARTDDVRQEERAAS